jgi:4-carboxymuconolactone decarboxylase
MAELKPPKTYEAFVKRFPKIAAAWEELAGAGRQGPLQGPLNEQSVRLVKLALSVGALREGAVHANVRKALAGGFTAAEVEQVIALAAGTIGLPATVAVYSWVEDLLTPRKGRK